MNRISALKRILNKYDELLQQLPQVQALYNAKIAREYRVLQDLENERTYLAAACRAYPWSIKRWLLYLFTFSGQRLSSHLFTAYASLTQKK